MCRLATIKGHEGSFLPLTSSFETATRNELAMALLQDYYLTNFECVVAHALANHGHCFTPDEVHAIERFRALSRPARMLYVRLFLRRGPVFRLSRLAYDEIGPCELAFDELERAGFGTSIAFEEAESAAACLDVLTIPELRSLARASGVQASGSKAEIVERLADQASIRSALCDVDRFVQPTARELFDLARVLFFGNRWQELSEFVLVDLNLVRYHAYEISKEPPLFSVRHDLDKYLESSAASEIDLGQLVDEEVSELARNAAQQARSATRLPAFRRAVDPARYLARLALAAARELERRGVEEEAASVYETVAFSENDADGAVEASIRLGILARRTGDVSRFDAASARILASPDVDEIARYALEERRAKLALAAAPELRIALPRSIELELEHAGHAGSKALYRSRDGSSVTIEQAVLEALGGDGCHAENALYTSLFGLLFWDQIFAPLPGAFLHPFQNAPLDVSSSGFFESRRAMLVERLEALARLDVADALHHAYSAHEGTSSLFVRWELYTADVLARSALGLGAALLPILERIARNPGRHSKGLPDLLIWEDSRVAAVEVKGPGDQVRLEQRLWHDAMLRAGLDVRIAQVRRTSTR
jgi:hypothetical protein